jgi:hypothetical protein
MRTWASYQWEYRVLDLTLLLMVVEVCPGWKE